MSKKILVVAAHPDDEVLGCGGTVAKLSKEGYECYTLILGEGKTSRGNLSDDTSFKSELAILSKEITKANEALGVKKVFTAQFPDNRFDSVSLLDIVKEVERIKGKVQPDIIFTHHVGDLNVDHQVTAKAVITATRPMKGETVRDIYAFEVPSSTEWNSFAKETVFVPNIFFNITDTVDTKLKSMDMYKSELREYPHPRSLQHIKELARTNGTKVGLDYSENFSLIRSIREEI